MAINTIGTTLSLNNNLGNGIVASSAMVGFYGTAVAAGGVNVQDAATITNPDTQIINETTYLIKTNNVGTFLEISLKYNDGLTGITNPVIKLFGRPSRGDSVDYRWRIIPNLAGSISVTLTTASTDIEDGAYKYTTPDANSNVFDMAGCSEFLVGIETALDGSGTVDDAVIQARIYG